MNSLATWLNYSPENSLSFSDIAILLLLCTRHIRKYVVKTTHKYFTTSFNRKDYSCCPPIDLAYEPLPYCSSSQIWPAMRYNRLLSDLFISRSFFPRTGAWTDVIFCLYIPGRRLFGVEFQVCWLPNISPPILQFLCLLDLCVPNKGTTFLKCPSINQCLY